MIFSSDIKQFIFFILLIVLVKSNLFGRRSSINKNPGGLTLGSWRSGRRSSFGRTRNKGGSIHHQNSNRNSWYLPWGSGIERNKNTINELTTRKPIFLQKRG
uniref:Uncharacterized protein n=1 Tax=Strongyloides venezuelensis TaxID=75913 RepID=A0A0K0FR28_STRVS